MIKIVVVLNLLVYSGLASCCHYVVSIYSLFIDLCTENSKLLEFVSNTGSLMIGI